MSGLQRTGRTSLSSLYGSGDAVNWQGADLKNAANSNLDFIAKAATMVASFTAGGALLKQQAQEFVELSIVESDLLQRCYTTIVPTSEYEIDKIGYTGQVLLPDEEDIAFAQGDVSTPETGKVSYLTKRYKAEIGLTYDTVKRVLRGNTLMAYLIELLSKAAVRDLTKAALQGDTSLLATSKENRLLRLQDGFLKRCDANVIDAEGARLSLELMDDMQVAMPKEYRYQKGLEYMLSANGPIDYKGLIRARATQLGDNALATAQAVLFDGKYPVMGEPLMPDTLTYNAEAVHTNALFVAPKEQLHVAYLDEMNIRTMEDIRAGKFICVMRFDVAFQVKHKQAVVKVTNIRDTR